MSILKKTVRGLIISAGISGMVLFLAACPEQKSGADEQPAMEEGMGSMEGMESMESTEGMEGMGSMEGMEQ